MTRRPLFALALLATAGVRPLVGAVPPAAVELAARGVAQLENEQPADAEATFAQLTKALPNEPLGWANRAIAALRQQQTTQAVGFVDRALSLAPGRPDLLAIKADVLQWSGRPELALPLYAQAAAAAPNDVEIAYALLRQAQTLGGPEAQAAADRALARLVELRPENLVVMLQRAQAAVRQDDRAAATTATLRVRELLWQAPPVAETALAAVVSALESGDLDKSRIGLVRLENVLKVTPMYQQGLRELSTGIQGIPVTRFRDEPAPAAFGANIAVTWKPATLASTPGAALALGDFDPDDRADVVWAPGDPGKVELRRGAGDLAAGGSWATAGVTRLLGADLDNDGTWDVIGAGPSGLRFWKGNGQGGFADATAEVGLTDVRGTALAAIDFDIEGDLDLVVAGPKGLELYRNNLAGPLEPVGDRAFPSLPGVAAGTITDLVASDLDADGDLDLAAIHRGGVAFLENLRQGRFADRTAALGFGNDGRPVVGVAVDLDADGRPELVTAGSELVAWKRAGNRVTAQALAVPLPGPATDLVVADVDNDGRPDLAVTTAGGVVVARQTGPFAFSPATVPVRGGAALAALDADADGDLDLVAAGAEGLTRIENVGGNANRWLAVRLRGLTRGNSKNNAFGLGSTVEIRNGAAYQLREVDGPVTHFGLGKLPAADVVRVVWTNGVPQNRLDVKGNGRIVEEQLLKGSCPFLYTWDGERIRFVTDLLWGAPMGLPVAPGVFAGSDPSELVKVEGAAARDGLYDLRITEELWEAAFFDHVRLWVVDHPEEVEVTSNLRILPEPLPEEVRGVRDVRPVMAAVDGRGEDATDRVAVRDEVYADGYRPSAYQGVAAEPWAFTFDLGEAPGGPIRLVLDGWIFPADASLNLAVAQREDLPYVPARLEVETAEGWTTLLDPMGFPAGKTKTMVVDTPPLPPGARRLRIVTSQWLHWDRIGWSTEPADDAPRVVARLLPASARLEERGFSRLVRQAPNAPHAYDYATVSTVSPWLPFPGHYTRTGDVRELLLAADDRSVVLAAGDEMRLRFDASALPPPAPGLRRTVFLESHGWDKDADRNTGEGERMEPLPFRAMTSYPYAAGESFPSTPELDAYRREWLTRELPRRP